MPEYTVHGGRAVGDALTIRTSVGRRQFVMAYSTIDVAPTYNFLQTTITAGTLLNRALA